MFEVNVNCYGIGIALAAEWNTFNIMLIYITLHYITLHYITLHYISLHYITLHYITLHFITYTKLQYSTVHYITYTKLQYSTVQYSTDSDAMTGEWWRHYNMAGNKDDRQDRVPIQEKNRNCSVHLSVHPSQFLPWLQASINQSFWN